MPGLGQTGGIMLAKLTLVLGGAASGKSAFAEQLICRSGAERVYIATAQAMDDEMQVKISAHRQARGPDWITFETPLNVAPALAEVTKDQVVLLDCATMWLSNHLFAESDLDTCTRGLLAACSACAGRIVIVSNEVGQGIVPDNALARQFRNAQGTLNQAIAAQSDTTIFVTAGLPLVLKGALA